MKKTFIYPIALTIIVMCLGCRVETVGDPDRPIKIEAHITIDIRQLKETASSIEDMVSEGEPLSYRNESLFNFIAHAYAETPQLKYMTDEVKSAIDSRRARFEAIKAHKKDGHIGENNKGYISAFLDNDQIKDIVEQENKDRLIIYKTIVEQNGFPKEAIAQVEEAFASEQKERASKGEKVQLEDGEWASK